MMYGISGTPGTGKSSIAAALEERGHRVVHAADTVNDYLVGSDPERQTVIIDEEAWAENFVPVDGFIEGHLVHLLPCDRVIILRCRPDVLRARLEERGYPCDKVSENAEAEAMDVILVETLEIHPPGHILEVDTTDTPVRSCVEQIELFIRGEISSSYGKNDWSEYLEPRT